MVVQKILVSVLLAAACMHVTVTVASVPGPEDWRELEVISSSTAEAGSNFGSAVSLDQRNLLIGQRFASVNGNAMQGNAHLYAILPDGEVTLTQTLQASDGAEDDRFGSAVAIVDDMAVVGAMRADVLGNEWQGVLYVYELITGVWQESAALTASDGLTFDELGTTLSSDGVSILGGAIQADGDNIDQGAGYLYSFSNGSWQQDAKLLDPDGQSFEGYSTGIAVRDDIAILGSPRATVGDNFFQGKAQIWQRDAGNNWMLMQDLVAADGAAFDRFGSAIDLSPHPDGMQAIVTATNHGAGGIGNRGAIYVYQRQPNDQWLQIQKLLADDASSGDQLGAAVATSGDLAAVGAPFATGNAVKSGATYVLERDAVGNWSITDKLFATAAQAQSGFGRAIGVSQDLIAVGADNATDVGQNEGLVYLFARNLGDDAPPLPPAAVPAVNVFGLMLLCLAVLFLVGLHFRCAPGAAGDHIDGRFQC